MKLTNNFSLEEFVHSNNALRMQIDNTPNREQIENLSKLCIHVLQPLRNHTGEVFHINSGYRSAELNRLIGGVPNSQHLKGQAADVRVKNPRKLLQELQSLRLDFDQAILYPTFVHLSYNSEKNRRQVLYAKGVQP